MNRRMVLKRLTSFPIPALTRTSVHARFSIPRENSAEFVSNGSDLKWERDLSRGTRRSVQRRSSILHPRLLLGSTAIRRRLYVCTSVSYAEEYRDVVPLKTRQVVEGDAGIAERDDDLRETAGPLSRS